MARAPAEKPEAAAQGGLHAEFLRGFSIETLPVSSSDIAALAAQLPPGTEVYIGWPSSRGPGYIIDTARLLHRAGLRPVPHIAACRVTGRDDLAEFLRRLTAEAGVDQVLVVGGQSAAPVGPFHAALQVFETGLFEEFGIRRIGIAGHPEGHPAVAREELVVALREKIDHGKRTGADIHVVTQFCFDPQILLDWEKDFRATFPGTAIRVGIPGPTSPASLLRYAKFCGIGDSMRFLKRGAGSVLKLASWSPDYILHALAAHKVADPDCAIEAVHFYSFGGAARTARWLAEVRKGE